VSDAAAVTDAIVAPTRRPHLVRRVLRRPVALTATLVVVAFVVIALGAPYWAPYDPIKTDYRAIRKAPSAVHLLGTDEVGRDVLSRLIWGARAARQQAPAPSWGSMLNAAQRYLSQAPWIALYPGLMIFIVVMALNVVGDGLRDALDPRVR